jgi:hypothetical protein
VDSSSLIPVEPRVAPHEKSLADGSVEDAGVD